MKQFTRSLLLLGALLAASAAVARSPVPIIERPNVPFTTSSGKPLTGDALSRAIISAGTAGKWEVVPAADGKSLRASFRVRNKHVIMVDIIPGPDTFSVSYADSVNMNYRIQDGAPVIHPSYNKWVDTLIESIRFELKKF